MLLGDTRDELGGSEWAHVAHGHLGGRPPAVDLAAEQRLAGLIARLGRLAHRLARPVRRRAGAGAGGVPASSVATAPPSSCPAGSIPFVALFAESAGRVLVTVAPEAAEALLAAAAGAGVPAQSIGTTGGVELAITGIPALPLDELRTAWEATLPALFA